MAKKKKKTSHNLIFIIISILFVVCVYFCINIIKFFKQPTNTMIVKKGELINSEEVFGYVIRDEKIIDNSTYTGIPSIQIEDSSRVPKSGTIISYVSSSEQEYINKIKELDKDIQKALEEKQDIFPNDVKILETDIHKKIYEIYKCKNDMYEINEYKAKINENIQKKAKIAGELSPAGSKIKELISKRNSYEQKINDSKQELKADMAGLVSYRVDNLENILTMDKLVNLTTKGLDNLKLVTGQIIPININTVKIINNFECYIAVPLYSDESKEIKLNDKVYMRFGEYDEYNTPATVQYISEEENGRLVVFKITNNVEELTKYRKINLDIAWWRYKGLKVPNTAIKDIEVRNISNGIKTKLKAVSIQKSSYTQEAWVKVIREAKDFSIIEDYKDEELIELGIDEALVKERKSIKIYDEILVNT